MGIAQRFNLKKNPFSDGVKTQVCSEIVGRFLQDVLGWGKDLDLDLVGPKEIRESILGYLGQN